MAPYRLAFLFAVFCVSSLAFATDARNAAVLGKGDNSNLSIVHLNSVSDEAKVEFRSQTVLIQVPVVVTDRCGKHLHGFNKEDFTVFENGKPVTVANFEELTASTSPLTIPPAQISVYPVDIRGLANSPSFVNGNSSGAFSGTAVSRQTTNRMWLQQSKIDIPNDFADMTGGKAFYNTNDLAGSFRRSAADASSYYMLGYYLDTKNTKPGWRKLQVKVGKKDAEVRAHNGFFMTNATMNPLLSRDRDMANALHSPIESTGVGMTVQWVGVTADGDTKKQYFPPTCRGGFEGGGRYQLNFDFAALAYDKDGKEAGQTRAQLCAGCSGRVASVRANGMDFRNVLERAPGKYTVRFVVRDNVTGKVGSVTAP